MSNRKRHTPAEQFAFNVQDRLNTLGWTQVDLAERLGSERSHVCRMLAAKHSPRLETVMKVAEALDCSAATLLSH